MRSDLAIRHNAAVGLLFGLAVGDALATATRLPPAVCGGDCAGLEWGTAASRSLGIAESSLRGGLLEIDLVPLDVAAVAIALAEPGAPPPLLADPDTSMLCALVEGGLDGRLDLEQAAAGSALSTAANAAAGAGSFAEAMASVDGDQRAMTGALAGLRWGPAGLPAAWVTGLHGRVGERTYGLRQLRRLAERLLRLEAPAPPEPRRSLGPRQVAPQLWLSNLHAVPRFLVEHPDGAVVSLCPTTGAFDGHPTRREFAIHDAGSRTVNPLLAATVDEVLATIEAFHDEGRDVLVHCHHGASRTGLILRAWLIERLGLSADEATTEAQVRWSKTSTWNAAFAAEIRRRAEQRS